jgi:hypothetical protein
MHERDWHKLIDPASLEGSRSYVCSRLVEHLGLEALVDHAKRTLTVSTQATDDAHAARELAWGVFELASALGRDDLIGDWWLLELTRMRELREYARSEGATPNNSLECAPRAFVDALALATKAADNAAQRERAAIVAWLRSVPTTPIDLDDLDLSARIERGEHMEVPHAKPGE